MLFSNISLMVTITAVALAIGGGIYEGSVVNPQWSKNPPQSLSLVQEDTGIPLQKFWIPVHIFITVAILLALGLNWKVPTRRTFILIAIASYIVMRVWSFAYFIPEMLAFQKVSLTDLPSTDIISRIQKWTNLTWWRTPLDFITFFCLLWAVIDTLW